MIETTDPIKAPSPAARRAAALFVLAACSAHAYYGTYPAASFRPNGYGLYDMAGNVWEWCDTPYDKAYLDKEERAEDGALKVMRGGSWTDDAFALRSANRQGFQPALRDAKYGFRCALPAASAAKAPPGMKAVPAGKARMGSPLASDEKPVHEVDVAAFYLDSIEVTQDRFQAIAGYNPSRFRKAGHPVERVNWYDAIRFCNARSKAEGLDTAYVWDSECASCVPTIYTRDALYPQGLGRAFNNVRLRPAANGYRLPTEAQWEHAARGGSAADFHWGANWRPYPAFGADSAEISAYAAWRGNAFDLGGPNPLPLYRIPSLPDPDPAIRTVRCSTSADLLELFYRGMDQSLTILLKDGEYDLAYWTMGNDGNGSEFQMDRPKSTLMGESRDPRRVIIRGRGFNGTDYAEEMIKVMADNITLAYLTLADVRGNAIKIQRSVSNLMIHNVIFEDFGERAIKAPRGDIAAPIISTNVTVRYCQFQQFTPLSADRAAGEREGLNYIAGVDVMYARNWHMHDNVFRNIRGSSREGRAGIFFWVNSRSLLLERNAFYGCDRGIALGNPSGTNLDLHVDSALVRNNLIVNTRWHAVEVCSSANVRFYHNTVYSDEQAPEVLHVWKNRGGNTFRNNIMAGAVSATGGGAFPDTANNYWTRSLSSAARAWFSSPADGDFYITDKAGFIDKGRPLSEADRDWEGQARDASPDLGMDELGRIEVSIGKRASRGGSGILGAKAIGRSVEFALAGSGSDLGLFEIHDRRGILVWAGKARSGPEGGIVWSGATAGGRQAAPGMYLASLKKGGRWVSRMPFPYLP